MPREKMLKLNLGCGEDIRSEYVNVDVRELVGVDVVADIRDLPFEDGSAEEVLLKDVLEHFADPACVLEECARVLRDGGEIWVQVPDWEKVSDEEFWKNTPFWRTERRVCGGQDNEHDQHKSLYTEENLIERMEDAGFVAVEVRRGMKPPLHWHLQAHGQRKRAD